MLTRIGFGILPLLLVALLVAPFTVTIGSEKENLNTKLESLTDVKIDGTGPTDTSITLTVDWWPMFHHDPIHTGYSTSWAPNTNQTLWNYTTGGLVRSSPAVADGKVYVGSDDKRVYAFGLPIQGIRVWGVASSKTVICQGCLGNITVTVKNLGDLNETFGLIVYSGSLGDPTPGQIETFWSMGDVNRNGYINILDLDVISAAWGSYPGHPNWNPDADLNQDDIVNNLDQLTCIYHFDLNIWAHFNLASVIDGQTVVDLPPGTSRDFTFTWNATGFAKGNYTLTAYAMPVPGETVVVDNTFIDGWVIVSMIGDITGPDGWPDGVCDMRDIGIVAKSFGAKLVTNEVDPKYGEYWHSTPCESCPHSPNCDVVYDGMIDMRDIGTVARHFGEIDP